MNCIYFIIEDRRCDATTENRYGLKKEAHFFAPGALRFDLLEDMLDRKKKIFARSAYTFSNLFARYTCLRQYVPLRCMQHRNL